MLNVVGGASVFKYARYVAASRSITALRFLCATQLHALTASSYFLPCRYTLLHCRASRRWRTCGRRCCTSWTSARLAGTRSHSRQRCSTPSRRFLPPSRCWSSPTRLVINKSSSKMASYLKQGLNMCCGGVVSFHLPLLTSEAAAGRRQQGGLPSAATLSSCRSEHVIRDPNRHN